MLLSLLSWDRLSSVTSLIIGVFAPEDIVSLEVEVGLFSCAGRSRLS